MQSKDKLTVKIILNNSELKLPFLKVIKTRRYHKYDA